MKSVLLFILCLPCMLKAETKFVVYQVKGNVSYTQRQVTKLLKIGQTFTDANAVINVPYNSAAILICNNYSLINLTKPDAYSLLKISDSCVTPVSSVTSVYFRFVWDELTQAHGSIEDSRKKYMHNVGAVTRGCEGLSFLTNYDTINYSNGFFLVKWQTVGNEKLVLYNNEAAEAPVLSINLNSDSINLQTLKELLKAPGIYYWNVQINNRENCPRKYLKFWDENDFKLFYDSLLNAIPANVSDAEKMYMLAFVLEYNYFYAESYTYYKLAYDKDPSNLKYQNSLQLFKNTYFNH